MAKYVELKTAIDAVNDVYYDTTDINLSADKLEAALRGIPAADVAPVVHGRWTVIENHGDFTVFSCSECSRKVKIANDYFGKPNAHVNKYYPYCHCGAKMDLEVL